jgi:hypothetical protein
MKRLLSSCLLSLCLVSTGFAQWQLRDTVEFQAHDGLWRKGRCISLLSSEGLPPKILLERCFYGKNSALEENFVRRLIRKGETVLN